LVSLLREPNLYKQLELRSSGLLRSDYWQFFYRCFGATYRSRLKGSRIQKHYLQIDPTLHVVQTW